ncbi:MAG TPA: Zn-dependent hydrolase [Gemmatimonadales bacterium]|nr:Zn-dependent hydrolase [Gemmatimonadales bacterium]
MDIDEAQLHRYLDELYAIGAEPGAGGGCYRPLYGAAWATACDLVAGWMSQAGLAVRRDAVGNVWGRLEASSGSGKAVVTGSHIDTVRRGGRLDGALGIVAGLVAVRAVAAARGAPKRPLEVLVVAEEEGSRFATNFWGSRAIVGAIDPREAETVTDADGVSLARAMRERGLDPAAIPSAARDDLDAFVELHIEQGAVLEATAAPLGVVKAIAGAVHLEIIVRGRADHAGTTPMDLRRDALVGAAAMVQAIASIAAALGRPAVATTGKLRVEPDQINVVPGRVVFTVDLRHADLAGRRALEERIRSLCGTIASERELGLAIRALHERPPVPMDAGVRQTLERAAKDAGVTPPPAALVSGAGHDAQVLAARCRVGMLFVPSIGGRSHCPDEATDPAHVALGTRVLAGALELLAY